METTALATRPFEVRIVDVGRGRPCERTRRAVVAAAVCATLVIALAWLSAPRASAPGRASLSGAVVEFTVPAHAAAGEVVDVDVPGAPAQDVEIPPGAVPGQEVSFTEASALQRPVRAAGPRALAPTPKAAAGEEEVEFKVPPGSGPGALLDVDVPGGGIREVEVPAGANPGEELSFVARTPSRRGGGGGGAVAVGAGAGAAGAGASLAGARQAGHTGPASAGHASVRTHALAASSAGAEQAGHATTTGAGHVSAASARTHALAAGASDAAAVASVAAAAAASGVGGGEKGGAGVEGEGDGRAEPEIGADSALADKIAAGFNPKTGKWRGTADDPFGWLKRQQYYEQEHMKEVAKWTQFIADQHAQGPDGYMTAIDNAKAVWSKTHPGLPFGAPVPYRARFFQKDWVKRTKNLETTEPPGKPLVFSFPAEPPQALPSTPFVPPALLPPAAGGISSVAQRVYRRRYVGVPTVPIPWAVAVPTQETVAPSVGVPFESPK